jgi:hypothetical protein
MYVQPPLWLSLYVCVAVARDPPPPPHPTMSTIPGLADDLLKRDPRMVERKKAGQKKARKKFQWVKR